MAGESNERSDVGRCKGLEGFRPKKMEKKSEKSRRDIRPVDLMI